MARVDGPPCECGAIEYALVVDTVSCLACGQVAPTLDPAPNRADGMQHQMPHELTRTGRRRDRRSRT